MKINLGTTCLQDEKMRKFISDLWCYEQADFELGSVALEDLKNDINSNIDLLLSGDYFNEVDSRYSWISSKLINSLKSNNVLELINKTKKPYEISHGQYSGFKFYIFAKLVSKQKLADYVFEFSQSAIEEPLGMSKQIRILKDQLRKKFIHFENRNLKIKWKDIPTNIQNNFDLIGTLFELEKNDFILLNLHKIDLDVQEVLIDSEGNHHSISSKYGKVNFEAEVEIKDKLVVEWASQANIRFDDVKFDQTSGVLFLEEKEIDFCTPDTGIAKLMSLLVDNVNSIVPYIELASASWHLSGEDVVKKFKTDGKTVVNTKSKQIIIDIKKKIKKFNLSNKLSVRADNGYGLFHTRSEYDLEDLANKLQYSDIPF